MKEKTKKKSTLGWVMEFAVIDRNSYIVSVLLAIISVFAGFVPYLFVANIVKALIDGERNMGFYLMFLVFNFYKSILLPFIDKP